MSLQAALRKMLSESGSGGAACEGRARVLAELLLAIEHNHARRLAALELVPAAALDPTLLRDALKATQALTPSAPNAFLNWCSFHCDNLITLNSNFQQL